MQQVADAAGVSRTTVSFVLNNSPGQVIPESTRERIWQVVHELDYAPNAQALNLVRGKTMMIALVMRKTSQQLASDAFMNAFMHGIMDAIEPEGFHLMLYASKSRANNSTYRELIRTGKVDGLIISSPMMKDSEIQLLHKQGTPIVLNGASIAKAHSVDVDNRQGARDATQHLIDLGHRRIGHISNAPFTYTASHARHSGYLDALKANNIAFDPALVHEGDFTEASGYIPMNALLDLDQPPTAVFVGSDTVALGAIKAIQERGLHIPNQISLIGFDNIIIGQYLTPALTTVHLPAFDLGKQAGAMVIQLIKGETPIDTRQLLPTNLIVRNSTAPAPMS